MLAILRILVTASFVLGTAMAAEERGTTPPTERLAPTVREKGPRPPAKAAKPAKKAKKPAAKPTAADPKPTQKPCEEVKPCAID